MEQPAKIDLRGDRWVACIRELAFVGFDFTGATFAAQVRLINDIGGSPLVNLGTVTLSTAEGVRLIYAGTDTIDNHVAAGRLDAIPDGYSGTDTEALSSIGIRINETTMEGLPFPETIGEGERGDDVVLAWDLQITPAGGVKDKYAGGVFIVRPGATQ